MTMFGLLTVFLMKQTCGKPVIGCLSVGSGPFNSISALRARSGRCQPQFTPAPHRADNRGASPDGTGVRRSKRKELTMHKRPLGNTDIAVAPLVFGGNVFGWTVDERGSFELLDRFFGSGFNAIDTADSYSMWVEGNRGGESETIIGNWLARSGKRSEAVIITKVGTTLAPDKKGLSAKRIVEAAEDSLRRLRTDYIDVYLSHFSDAETPIDDT